MQSSFGAGFLWGTPAGGAPIMFGALQDVSFDASFDQKLLYGQGSVALEMARGKAKLDFKATVGRIDPALYNSIFFNGAASSGQTLGALGEPQTIAATVTVSNASAFRTDLGVYNPALGRFLTRVSSSPATGQYAVNAGTGGYSFASADVGAAVKIYYTYGAAGGGSTLTFTNPAMDSGPVFRADLVQSFRGMQSTLTAYACQAFKLSLPLKQDDFTLPQFDFSAQDDGAGNVLTLTMNGY